MIRSATALALAAALLAPGPLRAAEYVQKQPAGTLRLEPENPAVRQSDSLFKVEDGLVESRLANRLLLTLSVEGAAPLKMDGGDDGALNQLVKALKDSGLWYSCEPAGPPTHTAAGDGRERWVAAVRLSPVPLKESTIELRPPPTEYARMRSSEPRAIPGPSTASVKDPDSSPIPSARTAARLLSARITAHEISIGWTETCTPATS